MAAPAFPAFGNFELLSVCGPCRPENQDAGAAWQGDGCLGLIVADGMGGHAAGREAAEIVVAACLAAFRRRPPAASWQETLAAALASAHAAVVKAQERPGARGMGATAAIAVLEGGDGEARLHVAHVGDSRVYLLRGSSLFRLTDDHSLVAQMVRDGWIDEEEAFGHPEGNVLRRAVGQAGPFAAEVQEPAGLESGDLVLVSSDGLHGSVSSEAIRAIAGGPGAAGRVCAELLAAALERGSQDNVTIGCCRLEPSSGPRRPTRVPRLEEK